MVSLGIAFEVNLGLASLVDLTKHEAALPDWNTIRSEIVSNGIQLPSLTLFSECGTRSRSRSE